MTYRILVADDSPTIQKVIRIAFSRLDTELIMASSFVEALSEASRSAPGLIVVDAGLPGTKSPDDFTKIKQAGGNVPVVLLVGSYEHVDEQAFIAAGLATIVKKPFDSADLVKTCTGLLAGIPGSGELPRAPAGVSLPPPPTGRATVPPTVATAPASGIPEFDLGADVTEGMFRVATGEPSASAPSTARDIELDPAAVTPGLAGDVPALDSAVESGRRGQKAFSDPHPATKTHYIPPPGAGGRGPTIAPTATPASGQPSANLPSTSGLNPAMPGGGPDRQTSSAQGIDRVDVQEVARAVDAAIARQLPRLVKDAVEDYCNRHFADLAREIITAELRRLADEKARHLVDS